MSNTDASRTLDLARASKKAYATVPEVAERFLADNSDFSPELKIAVRAAATTSANTEEFWGKVEVAMNGNK